jgi:hypothetical protein
MNPLLEKLEYVEKKHQELMNKVDEQIAIMDKINNSNIFYFIWNGIILQKGRKAKEKAFQYLDEGDALLKIL